MLNWRPPRKPQAKIRGDEEQKVLDDLKAEEEKKLQDERDAIDAELLAAAEKVREEASRKAKEIAEAEAKKTQAPPPAMCQFCKRYPRYNYLYPGCYQCMNPGGSNAFFGRPPR